MLARLVLLSQLAELCLYLAAGAFLMERGAGVAEVALLAVAVALFARLAIVCVSFWISWLNRTPRAPAERLGIVGGVAMVLREWLGMVVLNLVNLPWERWIMRPDPEPAPSPGPAIVLVHGYFVNRGSFRALLSNLEAAGVGPIFTPSLRTWLAPIERLEEGIAAAADRVARGTGRKVIVVAHSMGGLGTRAMLARRGAASVERVITIASPHHGTALARLGVGANARQMRRGSEFLRRLEQDEGAGGPAVPFTSIWSAHDNLVAPQETSRLPWAKNIALAGHGHIGILASQELLAALLRELRPAAGAPRP